MRTAERSFKSNSHHFITEIIIQSHQPANSNLLCTINNVQHIHMSGSCENVLFPDKVISVFHILLLPTTYAVDGIHMIKNKTLFQRP